ncbi:hypothetical protein A9K65_021745 [Mesorhizobium sp. WSM1497]|uniref:hypothetical protein n=1 Tax=Mesorhizobium sp. WSM1497 TaxID=278153 RepID=UPI0007EE0391|nr:hypothetical protein [Mesorhizobium sp. WSM1497]ARP65676.1 hypothetical protein A9K65_021745 [Mesorhizobium sp. WSM1497]
MARVLHFPKLNSSAWFDGSELDGIAHWGFRSEKWTMKAKPADRQPLPEVYGLAREAQKPAEVDLFRARANARFLLATGGRQHAQGASPAYDGGRGKRAGETYFPTEPIAFSRLDMADRLLSIVRPHLFGRCASQSKASSCKCDPGSPPNSPFCQSLNGLINSPSGLIPVGQPPPLGGPSRLTSEAGFG